MSFNIAGEKHCTSYRGICVQLRMRILSRLIRDRLHKLLTSRYTILYLSNDDTSKIGILFGTPRRFDSEYHRKSFEHLEELGGSRFSRLQQTTSTIAP